MAMNQNRGPEFEALAALVNLILLGLSVVVNQEPPFIPPTSASLRSDPFTFQSDCVPSDLLRRGAIRVAESQHGILTSDTVSKLHSVLDFIISAEHASIPELHTLYATAIWNMPTKTSAETDPIITVRKTAQTMNQCCHLAINIFWSIFGTALYPNGTSGPADPASTRTSIQALRATFRKVDMVTWKKHAPETYLWICFTAAAACDEAAGRVPFVAVATPVLSTSDTTELRLSRECWRYYKWLSELLSLQVGEQNMHGEIISELF
ncbi:uncharacterized protein BDW43DRAFT_315497 [Aspergillus alliaceus]|uniref:uncharacterized protein n=1 Tax=Petromyces alliaceus TaxID=209559 RepID=UPI0012A5E808|nr:uncharacterized protein BDW43DRAFT_315497 [Aspergillus alliaceus]KAB8228855.1 hypothetical protein BDW43DRAFT_315497 [Aspergillus alliaceus]